ncbi:helix-turn-helix domain-containing protein [Streptomyces sp. R302]|nr:helix-turn-helix domain-containing protein [Streptomyces sp. R301]NML83825.1 helix-turn-helix domain-containing protein [Streptomyces sp. R302]
MAAPTGPTIRRMQLGMELERLRKKAGFTNLKDAAHGLGISDSQLYRVEKGTSAFRRVADLVTLLERYGVTDEEDVEFLVGIHRDSLNRGWWSTYARTLPSGMAMYVGLEDGARTIRAWQPDVVFGLLQTENYARAVFQSSKLIEEKTTEFVERGVALRMERKDILTRENPVEIRAILCEATLRRRMGSQEVMRGQINHLIDLAALDNVTIQVLPLNMQTYRSNFDFTLMDFGENLPTVVQMDMPDGASNLSDKDTEVWAFSRRFDALRDGALPVGSTPDFLHQLVREI